MALTDSAPESELLWVLDTLMEVKASAEDTGGTLTVIEQLVTPAGNPPLHLHHHEDEASFVLEGELKARALPPVQRSDVAKVAAIAASHGIALLAPPGL